MNSIILMTTAWTLLHFVWQGAVIAVVLALANVLLLRATAKVRYLAACAGMLLMLASAAGTFVVMLDNAASSHGSGILPVRSSAAWDAAPSGAGQQRSTDGSLSYLAWLVYLWAAGVAILSVRSAGGWMLAQRLKRRHVRKAPDQWQQCVSRLATQLEMSRAVRLCESAVAQVPAAIGWLRPVILLPASALAGLPAAHLEALLAHELAHVRRHDYLLNLLQTAVETLLFYHPAVWWVSNQIRQERENCCDDLAVSVCGDVLTYARALTHLEQLRGGTPELAMAANGSSLLGRIQRLIQKQDQHSPRSSDWVTPVAVVLSAISVWAASAIAPSPIRRPHFSFLQILDQRFSHEGPQSNLRLRWINAVDAAPPEQNAETPEPPLQPSPAPGLTRLADQQSREPSTPADPEPPQAPAAPPAQQRENSSFIGGFAGAGYSGLSVDQLIAFKTHGVTTEYARQLLALGFKATPDQLVALRIHGVTPEFAVQSKAAWPNITIDQLAALRIHGADASTAGGMRALGYANLSVHQVLAMQIHGVTPAFAQKVKELGLGDPTYDQLVSLRIHGVTPEWAGEMKGLGLQGLNLDQLIALRIHGANGAALREMKALGLANLSAQDAIAISIHGLTPADVREAQRHGFKNLSLDQILKLKQFGILSSSDTI